MFLPQFLSNDEQGKLFEAVIVEVIRATQRNKMGRKHTIKLRAEAHVTTIQEIRDFDKTFMFVKRELKFCEVSRNPKS